MKRSWIMIGAGCALGLGAESLPAQTRVYSENAVGYYDLHLGSGFTMVANQFNNGFNTLQEVLPRVPDGSSFLTWNTPAQMFNPPDLYFEGLDWLDLTFQSATTTLNPGEGGFINLPVGRTATVKVLGEVPQSTFGPIQVNLVPGFQIISNPIPAEENFDEMGFPAEDGDTILFWNTSAQSYNPPFLYIEGLGWVDDTFNPADPSPSLGESVFYNRVFSAPPVAWVRTFSVNP